MNRNTMSVTLEQLKPGELAKVSGFANQDKAYRHKLMAMGLTRGTQFQVIRRAPLGCPIEIEVRGFTMSLRKGEAKELRLERVV